MSVHSYKIQQNALNLIRYAEAENVPYDTLTTILTYTATAETKIGLITCSGEDNAKFQLFVDTILIATKRAGDRNVEWNFDTLLLLNNGSIIDIKVTHWFQGDVLDFEAGLYAFN